MNNILAYKIFNLIILSMCVSTVSLTITKSKFFSFLRYWVNKRNERLGALLSCSYCMIHWVAAFFVVLLYIYSPIIMVTNIIFIDVTITIFATIALATIITGKMYFIIKKM
jgi:hypothetical protein